MTVRQFLYSCRGAAFEIRSLERQRDSVKIPMGPGSRSASVVELTSKDNDPTTTALNKYDCYDNRLREKIEEQKQRLMRFEDMISVLDDAITRTVMRYYFAQGWTNEQIAEELAVTDKTAKRRRWTALEFLERNFVV